MSSEMMLFTRPRPQESGPKILASIPCFNTKLSIAGVVTRARKYVDQVIVVDDGSQDGTAEEARSVGAFVISHRENIGYGGAMESCFRGARELGADALVILDGDGQHDPDDIPNVLDPILRGEAHIVVGSRFLDGRVMMPGYRKLGICLITYLWNLGAKTKVSDAQSGFRAYSRVMLGTLRVSERGMSASIEILEQARKRRAIIKEVPISCAYAHFRFQYNAFEHGLRVALSAIKMRLQTVIYTCRASLPRKKQVWTIDLLEEARWAHEDSVRPGERLAR